MVLDSNAEGDAYTKPPNEGDFEKWKLEDPEELIDMP